MAFVTGMIEEDVSTKIDLDFVQVSLKNVDNTVINFICLNEEDWDNDSWQKKGKKYYRIILPYNKVKNMDADAVRQWMLRLAEERLDLVGQA